MFHFGEPAWQTIVRTLVIYLAFIVALRLFGKREIGQFTLFDLVLILLVANAVQPAMTGPDVSLGGGLIIVVTLFALNFLLAALRIRYKPLNAVLEGHPTVIAKDGQWYPEIMRRQGVEEDDAMMALREHGVTDVRDTQLVVLEADGSISGYPESRRCCAGAAGYGCCADSGDDRGRREEDRAT